jgi:hypothetical protein
MKAAVLSLLYISLYSSDNKKGHYLNYNVYLPYKTEKSWNADVAFCKAISIIHSTVYLSMFGLLQLRNENEGKCV